MRIIPAVMFAMLLVAPAASAQIELAGSAGPTLSDPGNSVAAGVGFPVHRLLTLFANVERTHLESWTRRDGDVISSFRGGTLLLGSAELRVFPFGRHRVGPYGLAGLPIGVSWPNVNAEFPNPVTNFVGGGFFMGGGLLVPLGERLSAFADARMMIAAEGREGMVGVAPLRAGVSWRF